MSPLWKHVIVAAVIFGIVTLLERVVDWRLRHRPLPPEAVTRYNVLRRSLSAAILVVGLFSALLAIPEVRTVAGGLLASSALLGIVVGFASQRTLGNFVAGLLIAVAQPVRIGDLVEYGGETGTIEEIGLTYTFIRTTDHARLVVPNEKLASDSIRNASIRNRATFAEITVPLPLTTDLGAALDGLREEFASESDAQAFVSGLNGNATVTVRAAAVSEHDAEQLAAEMRLRAHRRLRSLGVWG
ncbi:MAG TPA: mechanosensitive ion channel domain-containing protein [Gaiellaceae bacterium]|nr:mechanosensitive ion channel domain-containing protein [Gaiellaceae bacterium]